MCFLSIVLVAPGRSGLLQNDSSISKNELNLTPIWEVLDLWWNPGMFVGMMILSVFIPFPAAGLIGYTIANIILMLEY